MVVAVAVMVNINILLLLADSIKSTAPVGAAIMTISLSLSLSLCLSLSLSPVSFQVLTRVAAGCGSFFPCPKIMLLLNTDEGDVNAGKAPTGGKTVRRRCWPIHP